MFIQTTPKNEQQLVSKLPTGFIVLLESSENHSYVWHCSTLRFPCYRGGFSTQLHQGSKGALHSRWFCTVTGLLVDMKKDLAGLGWPLPSFKFSALSTPPEYFIWILIIDLFFSLILQISEDRSVSYLLFFFNSIACTVKLNPYHIKRHLLCQKRGKDRASCSSGKTHKSLVITYQGSAPISSTHSLIARV